MGNALKNFLSNTIIFIGVFLACYLLMGQVIEVSGDSMDPTIKNGEQVIAEKISTKFGDLRRGEIIVFNSPEKKNRLLIKRVVAIPYDIVRVRFGVVYINGQVVNEPYLAEDITTPAGKAMLEDEEIRVKENEYLVMGDNRSNSVDSREYGPINKESVLGRALFVYSPIRSFRLLLSQPE